MNRVPIFKRYAFLWLLLLPVQLCAEPLRLLIPPLEDVSATKESYFYKLLALVVAKTEATDGPVEVNFTANFVSTDRSLAELKNGNGVTLLWTTTNKQREQDFLPIRISLIRELNNYRLFLIRAEDQEKFDKVQTLDDLRKFTAGLGTQWPETELLRSKNLKVVTSLKHGSLFKMLQVKRFDYFPRGLYEIWDEAELHKNKGLVIEKNLMLYYEAPFYFFVNKNNRALAERIERGLNIAIADGSFEELLMSVPGFKRGTEEQLNSHRKLFILTNKPE